MGYILDTPDDEFSVEVRRESFYLRSSEDGSRRVEPGTTELLVKDIPALRRALDRVEEFVAARNWVRGDAR